MESKIDLKGQSSLANQVLAFLKQRGSGNFVMFQEIFQFLNKLREQHSLRQNPLQESEVYDSINKLLEADRVDVKTDLASGELIYSFTDERSARLFGQMDYSQKQTYKLLKEAGENGLTSNELRNQLNSLLRLENERAELLSTTQISALLKQMEKQLGVVKIVKGQQTNRKKLFMLEGIEPSGEITGGALGSCNDPQQFDLINQIMDRVFDYLCRQDSDDVTIRELVTFMKQVGDETIKKFRDEDFQKIIEAMKFDERIKQDYAGHFHATNKGFPQSNLQYGAHNWRIIFTETPCAHCPLSNICSATDPNATVTPQKCTYLKIWELEF